MSGFGLGGAGATSLAPRLALMNTTLRCRPLLGLRADAKRLMRLGRGLSEAPHDQLRCFHRIGSRLIGC